MDTIESLCGYYLNVPAAEKLRQGSRGSVRCLLNMITEALIFRDGKPHPEVAFDLPTVPTDLFYVYSHATLALSHYTSNVPIDNLQRAASIKRLVLLRGAQRTLSSSNSDHCWDFMIVFDVLLVEHLTLRKERLDVPWVYELLSRSLMNDERMDYILSRSNDFEKTPIEELEWG